MPQNNEEIIFEPVFNPAPQDSHIIKEKDAEIQRLQRELASVRQTLSDALALNQELNRENSLLRQRNTGLEHAKTNSENKLQHLLDGIGKMRSGIGSRGVNDVKDMAMAVQAGIMI